MIAILIVLVLVGVGTFAVMGGFQKSSNPVTCWPPNSPVCGLLVNLHDVNLLIPFRSVQQASSVPFTASLPSGESASSFSFTWGDGTYTNGTHNQTTHHSYLTAGVFLVQVHALVNSLLHDNLRGIQQVAVTPSYQAASGGETPGVQGQIVSNSTTNAGARGATAILSTSQSVTVTGSYTSAPSNPLFLPLPPKIILTPSTGGSLQSSAASNASATATATFTSPGTYTLTFVGSATNTNQTAYQNFSWSVVVAQPGTHAGLASQQTFRSPHPGTIINYELAPGGSLSEDPAIDYETLGAEPIINVYQTLITYNGSTTGPTWQSYVPELATCVPGSPQCQSLYNQPMVDGYNYTFVISKNASFFDGTTRAHWGVYPTDVLFSFARTLGFSTLPCVACNNGWILAQALLDGGNGTWSSIHGPYNNTPANVSRSMVINDTVNNHCPSVAMTNDHGCITLKAWGNRHVWPYFLELVADPLGGSVVSCGWFSAPGQAAGIPYWTAGNVTDAGDHPCAAPGTGGYGLSLTSPAVPFTGWDHWEQLGSGAFGTFLGHVQWAMLGSGPYYVQQFSVGSSYTLKANPFYGQNPYCTWRQCQPAPGNYASTVSVQWETTATPGEQAYVSGVADHASIPSTDLALLLQLISQGKATAISAPTLTIGFYPFDMNFNLGAGQKFTTSPITVNTDFFSYLGMREYFATSFPYQTIQNTINTRDGIQLGFLSGGAIPQYMANYYPSNINWPSQDPCSDSKNTACPDYWWAQMQDRASPYFDPQSLQCTSSNPCQLPLFGATGSAAGDQERALWASAIAQHSSGAIKVAPVDINFVELIINSEFSGPGQNALPIYSLGWAPDYPDPTDYVTPLYYPNGTYTNGNSVLQSLLVPQFTQGCSHTKTDWSWYANNTFSQSCQGVAYLAMVNAFKVAAGTPAGPYRILLYDLGEKIANQLALYVYTGQSNQISSVAAWVDSSSINTNVTIGGGGDTPYFWLTGNDVQFAGST